MKVSPSWLVAFILSSQRDIILFFSYIYFFSLPVSWFVRREPIISFADESGGSIDYILVRLQPLSRVIEAHISQSYYNTPARSSLYAFRPLDK